MRITFVLPAFNLSGGIRVFAIYAERLRRRGHQVLALAQRDDAPTLWEAVKSFVKGKGWPAPRSEASHFDGLAVEHRLLDHPGPLLATDVPDADVIIASFYSTVASVAKLPDAKGIKVHFVQGYDGLLGPDEEVDALYRLPLPKVTISNWLRDLLQTRFQQTPVAVIPNSVDQDQFYAPPRGKQAQPTLGMVYNTLRIKGCDIGLRAYEQAARVVPDLKLVVMGEMPVVPELPLPKTAEFIGKARDQKLRETYSGCDAWLFPSRQEGFGLPILEAMACRTPVIAAPAGAAPELLARGGGLLVPAEDPDAMAQAILKVCRLPEAEWRALSDAALATATAYTWDDATVLLEQALQQVVRIRTAPPR